MEYLINIYIILLKKEMRIIIHIKYLIKIIKNIKINLNKTFIYQTLQTNMIKKIIKIKKIKYKKYKIFTTH
jgi:hypothetical protein